MLFVGLYKNAYPDIVTSVSLQSYTQSLMETSHQREVLGVSAHQR